MFLALHHLSNVFDVLCVAPALPRFVSFAIWLKYASQYLNLAV
jgi:hypothetical protein